MQDWSAILKRISASVSQAAVLVEDLTEEVAAAVVEGASRVSRGRGGGDVEPQVAVELLWRLNHLGLSQQADGVMVKFFSVHLCIMWHDSSHTLIVRVSVTQS